MVLSSLHDLAIQSQLSTNKDNDKMTSLITPNTTTNQTNNIFTNSNNLRNNQKPLSNPQLQHFSHYLEAFITLVKELNITNPAYNFLLALLAYTGNRTTFFASHEILYPLIHNYKNPKTVEKVSKDTARKFVWRTIVDTESWMNQIGIILFTRTLPEKPKHNEQTKSTEYNIFPLITALTDIVQEAHATIQLHNNNIGQAIQAIAIKKAQELKQSATPKPITQNKNNQKQLNPEQQLDKILALAESSILRYKAFELANHTSREEIALILETKFQSLFNLYSNTIFHLKESKESNLDSSEIGDFCPAYQSHIYNYSFSASEMSHTPPGQETNGDSLSTEEILSGDIGQIEIDESQGYGTNMSHTPLGHETEQTLINQEETDKITVTFFDSQYEKSGVEAELTLKEFVEHIAIEAPVVIVPKSDSDKDILAAKQKNKGFCPATFISEQGSRTDNNVESLSMVCFDYDDADFRVDLKPILDLRYRGFVYTSYRHSDTEHRFRLGFVLKEPIPAKYYNLLWQKLFGILKREVSREGTKTILNIDSQCFNPSRMWYLPAVQSKDAAYYSEVFDLDGYEFINWRVLIEQEIRDFEANKPNLFEEKLVNSGSAVVEQKAAEEKNKKNVTQSSYVTNNYAVGTDKPSIDGYRWPSYLRALREKVGDVSAADSSWCFFCAVFGIPEDVAAMGLLQVSEKANYKASRPYGGGRYYHLDTVREAYDFYRREKKKKEKV